MTANPMEGALSEDRTKLVSRIVAAALDVGGKLSADKTNTEQRYDYLSADKILSVCGQALAAQGVVVVPEITEQHIDVMEYTNQYNKQMRRYDAAVTFAFHITDGAESIVSRWAGCGSDYSVPDKALYKAITSGHKYFLMKLLCVGAGNEDGEHEDEDGEKKPGNKPAQRPAQSQPQPSASQPSQPRPAQPITPPEVVTQAQALASNPPAPVSRPPVSQPDPAPSVQAAPVKPEPPAQPAQPIRPYSPEKLRAGLKSNAAKQATNTATVEMQHSASVLDLILGGEEKRHLFVSWLTNGETASLKDAGPQLIRAIHAWLKPSYDRDAKTFNFDQTAKVEALAVMDMLDARVNGQTEEG